MIIYYRFSTFSYSFTEGISKRLIDIVNPYRLQLLPILLFLELASLLVDTFF